MTRAPTLFLKAVTVLAATGTLAGLMWFPHIEGRAANLDLISIYADPFIIYIYIASIPFFIGLYQVLKLLQFIDSDRSFSTGAVAALKTMKFASLSLIGFIALAELYIRFFAHGDDPAGPTMLGMCMVLALGVIAATVSVLQTLVQRVIDTQSNRNVTA